MIRDPLATLFVFLLAFNLVPALLVFLLTHPAKHYRRRLEDGSANSGIGHSAAYK